ncbi:MAG TPA: hypothetical protein VJA94_02175 [Candidatus Angelobacter sp.]
MKVPLAAIVIVSLAVSLSAQTRSTAQATPQPQPTQPAGLNLNSILADIQRVSLSTNGDLSKLRIERWKTDNAEKQQMQQVVNSLQRNINAAIPGLISDAQAAPGSVARTFKLYHNLNVVYEFLNSIAESAGAFGRKEEYDPLAADAAALDTARQNLSNYIEQVATNMEIQTKQSQAAQQAQSSQAPKKVVIDDSTPQQKKKKKKTASPPPPQ